MEKLSLLCADRICDLCLATAEDLVIVSFTAILTSYCCSKYMLYEACTIRFQLSTAYTHLSWNERVDKAGLDR